MKILAKIILSVVLAAPLVVHADAPPPAPSESQLVEHGSYINKPSRITRADQMGSCSPRPG